MISFIVAMDRNRIIGKDNELPWHLPADLAYFKKITSGHTIIMGRKTFQSIGRPLPNRRNIVLSRNSTFQEDGIEIIDSLEDVLTLAEEGSELFVIGGSEIFRALWDYADRLYVTWIDESFKGDTTFPRISEKQWVLTSTMEGTVDKKNKHPHQFRIYDRIEES